jgi:hypothetical protein
MRRGQIPFLPHQLQRRVVGVATSTWANNPAVGIAVDDLLVQRLGQLLAFSTYLPRTWRSTVNYAGRVVNFSRHLPQCAQACSHTGWCELIESGSW